MELRKEEHMNIVDLHNHTTYSYDGSNTPEEIIENAIANEIDIVGITDHQFSVLDRLSEYIDHINRCKKHYEKHIKVLCGLEIGTRPVPYDLLADTSKSLDYCLFESLDSSRGEDIFEFFEWRRLFKCRVGLAHTDIFKVSERYGVDMLKELKERDIFWELNTSGNYSYYYDFITNPLKREQVSMSGIRISVGSDTHWIREYDVQKVRRANKMVFNLGNSVVFADNF